MAEGLVWAARILFAAAMVFFLCTVILWFQFKVPAIVGDLSGRTARKSIETMRKRREENAPKPLRLGEDVPENKKNETGPELVVLEEVLVIHTREVI